MARSRCRVVIDNSAQVKAEFRSKVAAITAKAALDTEGGAKVNSPVETGFLRNSIQAVKQSALQWIVGVGALYGKFVEEGTYKMAAHPYLGPAYLQAKAAYIQALKSIKTRGMR